MQRRGFIATATYAMLFHDAHVGWSADYKEDKADANSPLIGAIELLTTSSLLVMKEFYHNTLGLRIINEVPGNISFQAGTSVLSFVNGYRGPLRPFYHFAFNISENKIEDAYHWQKTKTPIVLPRPGMQATGAESTPNIVHFRHWDAHSIFFLDPAGNLVEYIARHALKNFRTGPFSTNDIDCISEIGLITDQVDELATTLSDKLSLKDYINGSPTFRPMGNEYGLILAIKSGINWVSRLDQENKTDVFKTIIQLGTGKRDVLKLQGGQYEIH